MEPAHLRPIHKTPGRKPVESTRVHARVTAWQGTGVQTPAAADVELHIDDMVGSLVALRPRTRSASVYRVAKRALDLLVSAVLLVLLLPIFVVAALAILLDTPGPIFYVQRRVGEGGRLFPMIKFRSMRHGSTVRMTGAHKRRDDDRVTRVGRVLRKTSIDELPQLINVLLGQMSLVGPRPEIPAIVLARYQPWQYQRFVVPQGITGWWQVTGRGTKLLYEHTGDDLYYIEHASFWFDLRILLRTIPAVIRREGAF